MTSVRTAVTDDGVAVLTLDGADRLNVFSAQTAAELGAAYQRCDRDDDVRVVVLTGAGRAFCAGADLSTSADSFGTPDDGFSASPVQPPAWRVRKLVIAAINGHAIGIGLTIALQCDVRFVAADAKVAIPQVRRGMVGDAQSHWTLRHAVGLAVAADLLLTGRTLSGQEAADRGIASRALPGEQVLPAAMELAGEVAAEANPASVAHSKRLLWSHLELADVGREETRIHHLLMGGADAVEGAAAWRAGRTPRWTSKASETGDPA